MLIFAFTAPNRPLSINESNRMHWATRRRRLKPWADATSAAYRLADPAERASVENQLVRVHVRIPFPRRGRRDPHNYSSTLVKTIIDALIANGMAPDDTPEFVTVADPTVAVDPTGIVTVMIEPLEKPHG